MNFKNVNKKIVEMCLANESQEIKDNNLREYINTLPNNIIEDVLLYIDENMIKLVNSPTKKMKLISIDRDPSLVLSMVNPSEDIVLSALEKNGYLIKEFENQTLAMKKSVIRRHALTHRLLDCIDDMTEELKEFAVTINGLNLEVFENPSEKIINLALKSNGSSIRFINEQTKEMQIKAVTSTESALPYIKGELDEEVALIALKKNGKFIRIIGNPTEKMELAAVTESPVAIDIIREQHKENNSKISENVILKHISSHPDIAQYSLKKEEITENIANLIFENATKLNSIELISSLDHDIIDTLIDNNPSILPLMINKRISDLKYSIYDDPSNYNPSIDIIERTIIKTPDIILGINNINDNDEYFDNIKTIAIGEDPTIIKDLKNLPDSLKKLALSLDGNTIRFIEDQTKELQIEALNETSFSIKHFKVQTEEMKNYALNINGHSFHCINEPTEEMKKNALKTAPVLIKDFDNPTDEMWKIVLNINPELIKYNRNQTKEMQLISVNKKGLTLENINNPDYDVMLAAVKENGDTLKNIKEKDRTEELIMEGLKSNGRALIHINEPTEEMKRVSIKSYPPIISKIDNPSIELQILSVEDVPSNIKNIVNPDNATKDYLIDKNPLNVEYIKILTEEQQVKAVKGDTFAMNYITNPCKLAVELSKPNANVDYVKNNRKNKM